LRDFKPTFRDWTSWLNWYHLLDLYILHGKNLVRLRNFYAAGGPQGFLNIAIDGELTGGQGTNHEETGTDTSERTTDTELLGDLDEAAGGSLSGKTLGLVDPGEHGVGRLGDDSGGETSHETRAQVVNGLHARRGLALVDDGVDGLVDLLEDDELGHGVGNLLEQDRSETRVEGTDTLVLQNLGETTNETVGKGWVTDEPDTGSLKGAESDIGEELGDGSGGEVDGGTVVRGGLVTDHVNGLLLEELITTELEGTLEKVTSGGGTETSPDGAGALVGDDLAEATDEAGVVGDGVKLDAGLDDIDGGKSTVSDGAADGTSESESRVQSNTSGCGRVDFGSNLGLCGVELGGASGGGWRGGGHFASMDCRCEEVWSGEVQWC
jgi:hypothetical protein